MNILLGIFHRLDLNLKSSKNEDDNIALNFSVRFIEKCIIRNTRENGEWGVEERKENLYEGKDDVLNPITPGSQISAIISSVSDLSFNFLFDLCFR